MALPYREVHHNGFTYLHADGRVLQVPSGGAPDGDLIPPADTTGAMGEPPAKLPWDKIDWESGPKLTDNNLPPPIQAIFNRALAKDRREHEQRHGETQAQLRDAADKRQVLEAQLADLNAALEEIKNPPPATDDPLKPPPAIAKHPDLAKAWLENRLAQKGAEDRATQVEQREAELKKQFEALQGEILKERETRTQVEQRILDARRDREITNVLAQLKVFNPSLVLPLYAGRTEYQADRDSFVYRNANGDLVDLVAGIKAELPDNFVLPDLTNGGSGAHGASGGGTPSKPQTPTDLRTKLSQEREAMKAKRDKGQRLSGNEQARLMAIGRELDSLGPA